MNQPASTHYMNLPHLLGADFETVPFTPGCMAPPPVVLALAPHRGEPFLLTDYDQMARLLEQALTHHTLVIARAAYDMAVTCAEWPHLIPLVFQAYDEGRIKDPLIRQKLIDLALGQYRHFGPYSLEGLVKRLAGVELRKEDSPRLDYERFLGVPLEQWPEEHRTYPLSDTSWHLQTYLLQEEGLEEEGRLEVLDDEDRQARADFALELTRIWGLRTDPAGVLRLKGSCEKRVAELVPHLQAAGFISPNSDGTWSYSKAPIQERVFKAYGGIGQEVITTVGKRVIKTLRGFQPAAGWGRVPLTKTGKAKRNSGGDWQHLKYVATDHEACNDSGDDLLLEYTEWSQLSGMLNGQLQVLERGIYEPLHTNFEVLMETGRTSSSGGNAGNVQNVRRAEGTRECFTPREGWVYIGVDFDKAELHTVSQTCIDIFGRSTMAEALNAGKDPHTMLGARLAGMSYEEAVERLRLKDKIVKEWRQRAKPGNFGFLGGMGALGMQAYAKAQYGVKMTLEECEQLLTGWQETWPVEAVEYLNWIRELCAGGGYADIKHFISNRWRTRIPYCVAANSFFQGRAADGAKKALYEVVRRCYSDPNSALYGCRPVNFVHDEIITEAPLDRASDAAWEKRDVMVEAFNHFTPDVPVRATPVLMDRWSKSAEHLVDSNGNLQVWHYEPEAAAA